MPETPATTPASTSTAELGGRSLGAILFLLSASLIIYELVIVRIFAVVLFAHFANLAISLALLGIGFGATLLHLRPSLVPGDRLQHRLGILAAATSPS